MTVSLKIGAGYILITRFGLWRLSGQAQPGAGGAIGDPKFWNLDCYASFVTFLQKQIRTIIPLHERNKMRLFQQTTSCCLATSFSTFTTYEQLPCEHQSETGSFTWIHRRGIILSGVA
jgi:hypothetical protein